MPQKFGIWKHSLQRSSQSSHTQDKAATIASYRVCHVLGQHKPFEHGDILKEAFVEERPLVNENLKEV